MPKFLWNLMNICLGWCLIMVTAISPLYATANFSINRVPITTDSRIKTLVFNENEIYQLKFFFGYQSFIEFSNDEKIELISLGESYSWKITPIEQRLFIRPLVIGAHTNMTIITSKRTYQFDISSGQYDGRSDEELVYTVRFFYPDTKILENILPVESDLALQDSTDKSPLSALNQTADVSDNVIGEVVEILDPSTGSSLQRKRVDTTQAKTMNFNYTIAGESVDIVPTKVYDDGRKTYFQFPNNNLIIPIIYRVDGLGREMMVRYAIEGNFVVVDGVEKQFSLRLADSLLCIFNVELIKN